MSTKFHAAVRCPCGGPSSRQCDGPWYEVTKTRFGWRLTYGHGMLVYLYRSRWRRSFTAVRRVGERLNARDLQRRITEAEVDAVLRNTRTPNHPTHLPPNAAGGYE